METNRESDQVPIMHEEYCTLFILKEKNNSLDGFMEPFCHIIHKRSILPFSVFSSPPLLPKKENVSFHLNATFSHTYTKF